MIRLEVKIYNMISTETQKNISALSSGKIYKYEYLTVEKILPFDQRRVIGQAKPTYFPLGKTIEDQSKKQIKSTEYHGKQLVESNTLINKHDYDAENKLLLKAKEIYDKIVAERKNEINTLNNKIEYDKLTFHFKRKDRIPINFKDFTVH